MTTIVWHKRKLYTDSRYLVNGEQFDSLTKVVQYENVYRIHSEENKVEDRLLGFFCTGSQTTARAIMDKLCTSFDGNIDLLMTALKTSHGLNLIVNGNQTEVILICNKKIYSINSGIANKVSFREYDLDDTFHLGSGGEMASSLMIEEGVIPLRAMHTALFKDEFSGGLIDIWEHFESSEIGQDAYFNRIGIDNPLIGDLAFSVANLKKPYKCTFISQAIGQARWAMEMGLREPEDIQLLRSVMVEINAQRDVVEAAKAKARERKEELAFRRWLKGKYIKPTPAQLTEARTRWVMENLENGTIGTPTSITSSTKHSGK